MKKDSTLVKVEGLRRRPWIPSAYFPTNDTLCLLMEKGNIIIPYLYTWGNNCWIRTVAGKVYTILPDDVVCFLPAEDCEIKER